MKAAVLPLVAACSFAALNSSVFAALVAGWDFQGTTAAEGPIGTAISMPPTTPRDFTANAGVFQATSHLYFDGTNGSSSFFVGTSNADTELGALNGITANTTDTLFSTANGSPNGGSLALFNRAEQGGINGKSAVFRFSMSGYQDLMFSFAVQRPVDTNGLGYGVSLFTFSYSTDGVVFLPWGSIDTGAGTSVINTAFSMPTALSTVNDAATVYLKMTVSGSTGSNSTRIDNVQLNATAVPEPSALCGLLGGIAALLSSRRCFRRAV